MCDQQAIPDLYVFLRVNLWCVYIVDRCDLFVLLFSDQLAGVAAVHGAGIRAIEPVTMRVMVSFQMFLIHQDSSAWSGLCIVNRSVIPRIATNSQQSYMAI